VSIRDCARYRAGLGARAALAGAEAVGERDPAIELRATDEPDLDRHLAACRACRTEVEELALLSFAIRRAWRETGDLEPPADAWARLSERVSTPRPARRLTWAASSLAGLAMGTALAIGLIAPLGAAKMWGGDARVVVNEAGAASPRTMAARSSDDLVELDWMRAREDTDVVGVGHSRLDAIAAAGPRAVFATVRREQSRYAEDRWDERPPGASEVPAAIVL
jgi:hypothetical protein